MNYFFFFLIFIQTFVNIFNEITWLIFEFIFFFLKIKKNNFFILYNFYLENLLFWNIHLQKSLLRNENID
jgi:hypothetical protein